MSNCTTTYTCEPVWFDSTNEDVIAYAKGLSASDINVTCIPNTGTVEFQIKDDSDEWVTPSESSFTVNDSSLVRLPRENMPDIRIIATGDGKFSITGDL